MQYYLPEAIENIHNDPWRCSHCQMLMYNLLIGANLRRFPIPGSPTPNEINPDYPEVCSLCLYMYRNVAERSYFVRLHKEWKEKNKHTDRLRPGNDYL